MIAARAALAEARDSLRRDGLGSARDSAEYARAGARRRREHGHGGRRARKAAIALNKAAIGYQELARQAETDRALYESVLRQIKETNLTKDVKTNAVSVIEHSPVSVVPGKPESAEGHSPRIPRWVCRRLWHLFISPIFWIVPLRQWIRQNPSWVCPSSRPCLKRADEFKGSGT